MFNCHIEIEKRRIYRSIILSVVVGLAPITSLFAANPESIVAEVTFVDPITITENNALQFGLLSSSLANAETVTINLDSSTTDASGRIIGGTQATSDLTVTTTALQAITVLVDNIVNGVGYGLGTFLCDYDGGATTGACDGAGMSVASSVASATVLVGSTLTGDGLASAGVKNGSFDVTVSYQ